MATNYNNPQAVAEAATRIYEQKYKADFEQNHRGEFVAINVVDESATLGATATEALTKARQDHPGGFFHLIRIGHSSTFEVGLAYRHVTSSGVH